MNDQLMSIGYIEGLDISDAFKDVLKQAIETPLDMMRASVPENADAWRATIATIDGTRIDDCKALLDALPVRYEESSLGGVKTYVLTPDQPHPELADHVFFHFHGGAYVFSGGLPCLVEPAVMNIHLPIKAVSVDYRMPPDHPAPAAIEDGVAAYRALLADYAPDQIICGGASAGAGLTFATLQAARDMGLPMPRAVFAGTPWVDLSLTGDTLTSLEGLDRILVTYHGVLGAAAKLYANGLDLKDPRISPIYGDFNDFPPTFLVSGTRDMLLSDTSRLHRKLRNAGVRADLNVFEAHAHADYLFGAMTPEVSELFRDFHKFLLS